MAQKTKKTQKSSKTQKVSAKQRAAKVAAAQEREAAAAAKKAQSERWKKIGIIVVCAVLILALGLPTLALSMCSQDSSSGASVTATDPNL